MAAPPVLMVRLSNRAAVCMIMLPAFMFQSLMVADSMTGQLKLVLSPSGCSVSTYTHPKEQFQIDLAEQLKAELITLANQAVNN